MTAETRPATATELTWVKSPTDCRNCALMPNFEPCLVGWMGGGPNEAATRLESR